MKEKKQAIRENKKNARSQLDEIERFGKTNEIKKRLFSLDEFKNAKSIAFYVGIEGEINTLNMINEALAMGKRVLVPATDFKKKEMKLLELASVNDLEEKTLSNGNVLLEPKKGREQIVKEKEVDLVIVPLIAFDEKCHRIGSGIGFYDRFLKKLESHIPTIGLAFEFQGVQEIPVEEHDVRLKKILTEKRIIAC